MIQKIKNKLIILASLLLGALPLAVPAVAIASHGGGHIVDGLCKGADELVITDQVAVGQECRDIESGSTGNNVNDLIRRVINILSVIIGVIAVIMIIIGGLRYITSGGSAEKITGAKNTILYALIGLIIVALAQVIVRFVLRESTNLAS